MSAKPQIIADDVDTPAHVAGAAATTPPGPTPPAPIPPNDAALTPMMAQYWAVKNQYPDALVFYRMGDFFEMFFDDAEKASRILDIALTKRGKDRGAEIPMCGVPVHSHESYLARLIKAGCRVAICEQTETPEEAKKRGGYKALVNRDVVRLITPGTLTEDTLLNARDANYVAALATSGGQYALAQYALAWADMSTGAFYCQSLSRADVPGALARIDAREVIMPDTLVNDEACADMVVPLGRAVTPVPKSLFDADNAKKRLHAFYGVDTLQGFGSFQTADIAACGTLLDYIERTQKNNAPHIRPPQMMAPGDVVEIDSATRRNLELTRTLAGERAGSLLAVVDRTVTSSGARLLGERLAAPSRMLDVIAARHDQAELFLNDEALRLDIRDALKRAPDIERACSRLALRRGGPRDLAMVRDGLNAAQDVRLRLAGSGAAASTLVAPLQANAELTALVDYLAAALADDLPVFTRDGGFIRAGYNPALDELKLLRDDSRKLIANLQAQYANDTGIQQLKISHNNILGYYIEVPSKVADRLMVHGAPVSGPAPANDRDTPRDNPFVHRQTLANVARFTTPQLSELEARISSAADRAVALEVELFEAMREQAVALARPLAAVAHGLAACDVAAATADLAARSNHTRPVMEDSCRLVIEKGRHPVVEANIGASFMPNDCDLSNGQRLWLLTGPNMAGKSTFLRQNALIVLMAQAGLFVPAQAAVIGLCDRIFSRVGAADDLARGHSTFMVEMVETAAILNLATERSLVILDEIGRGTATFDGLSIAWGVLEYLHDINRCRGLFATHYHELNNLAGRLGNLSPHAMKVQEWKGEIVFLHEVVAGGADRSYGLHVAKLAGLPEAVLRRAKTVLAGLEKSEQSGNMSQLAASLPLFAAAMEKPETAQTPPPVKAMLDSIEPDALSPREALEWLYTLKREWKN